MQGIVYHDRTRLSIARKFGFRAIAALAWERSWGMPKSNSTTQYFWRAGG